MKDLFNAGRFLLADFLSTILFVVMLVLVKSVAVAIGGAIAAGVLQIVWLKLRRRPVDAMTWLSLALVVVMGGASLLTHDLRFILVKPTVIYLAVGGVMLKPGWMNRYVPPIVMEHSAGVVRAFGYVWAGMMFVTAIANLVVALSFDTATWTWFIGVVPVTSKVALFLIQFLVIRTLTRRRVRAARALQALPA